MFILVSYSEVSKSPHQFLNTPPDSPPHSPPFEDDFHAANSSVASTEDLEYIGPGPNEQDAEDSEDDSSSVRTEDLYHATDELLFPGSQVCHSSFSQ